jgi:O-antigen/teichoic acid export membrane protein
MHVLVRSTLIYAPAILFTRISALVLLMLATRLMDQTEYGLLALVVTIGEMTDAAVSNWLRIALLRLGGKGTITTGSLARAGRVLAATTAIALVLSVGASILIVPERWGAFSLAVGAYLVIGSIGRFALCILQMQQRHGLYSMLEFLRAALGIALPVVAILTIAPDFLVASLASSLAALIAGSLGLVLALRKSVAGPPRFSNAALMALGLPLIVLAIIGFGINSAERLILKVFYDAGAVAVYAAAYALARQPIDVVANAINMGAFPELVSRFDEEGPDAAGAFMSQQLALMARLCLPIAALLIALSGDITDLVLPPDYHDAVVALFPIIVASVLFANFETFVFENIFHAHKRNWLLIAAIAPGSVAGLVLGLVLVPPFGALGAGYALAGGSLVGLIASIVLSRPLTRLAIPYGDLLNSTGVAMACGLAAWLVSTSLPEAWPILRLALAGIAGGAVFLGLTSLLHPAETRALLRSASGRLGLAR